MKVLLVEENPAFRKSFSAMLSARFPGLKIEEALGAREVLEMVQTQMPDLIFLDLHLPEENGLELAKRIKGAWPSPLVVILASHDLPEYREAAERSGADCLICKDKHGLLEVEKIILALSPGADWKLTP